MNRYFAAIFFVLPVIGCGDGLQSETPSDVGRSELRLEASVREESRDLTKGSVSGAAFRTGDMTGLFVSCHDPIQTPPADYIPHQMGYNNIRATSTGSAGSGWSFYNSVLGTTFSSFFLTSRSDSLTADIYAYFPYMAVVTRPDSIPFLHSNNYDLMWADENDSPAVNKDIRPDGGTKTIPLHFMHSLCRLRFNFKTENPGSDHYVDYIHIIKAGNLSTRLYKSGIFNAIDGTFSDMVEVGTDSLCVSFSSQCFSDNADYTPFDILLYQTEVQPGGDLIVVFGIDGFRYTHVITRAEVEHRDDPADPAGNGTCGFKRGYTYTFNFMLDNYVHLQNIEIKSDWTPDTIDVNI